MNMNIGSALSSCDLHCMQRHAEDDD
jgi:hypothetical protein